MVIFDMIQFFPVPPGFAMASSNLRVGVLIGIWNAAARLNHPAIVSLYESGDRTAAAAVLRRALPNLQRSPYIEAYGRKILGQ